MENPKKTEFKRIKNFFPNESMALAEICEKENLSIDQLEAAHKDHVYVWHLKEQGTENQVQDNRTFSVPKSKSERKEAIETAMAHFETFQSNLEVDETETDFVFSRIR